MTAMSQFDRIHDRLPELLDELGAPSLPDYTDDLLVRTSATRQRPRWTFIERWLPMGVIARERIYLPRVPWRLIAVAALIIATVVAVLLAAGARRPLPPPFGPAANGALVFDRDGDIYLRTSLSAEPRPLVVGDAEDFAPGFSRDGTQIRFLRIEERGTGMRDPDVLGLLSANADGSNVRVVATGLVGAHWFDWSPDDRFAVAEIQVDLRPTLHLIDLESGDVRSLGLDFPSYTPVWRGPDGAEIIFRGWKKMPDGITQAFLWSIRPDGSNLHPITPGDPEYIAGYDAWSVSPDGRWVVYNGWVGDDYRLHLLEIDSGDIEPLELGPPGGHQGFASFSPDGKLLLFHWISNANEVQAMVAPLDGTWEAVPIGPNSPVVGESATLQQAFSPDGESVIFNRGRDRQSRIVDATTGGLGELLPWDAESIPSWQRLAFPD